MEKKYRITFFFTNGDKNVITKELSESESDSLRKEIQANTCYSPTEIPCDGYTFGVNWKNCIGYAVADIEESKPVPEEDIPMESA